MPAVTAAAAAVVGIAGPVGRELGAQLDVDPEIGAILGIDDRPPQDAPEKLRPGPRLGDDLIGPFRDAGVKLAAFLAPDACGRTIVTPPPPPGGNGGAGPTPLERFLAAAAAAQLEGIVIASGALIYDAAATGPLAGQPWSEGAAIKVTDPGLGAADLARETVVARFARAHPNVAVALARLAPPLGPGTAGLAARYLSGRKIFALQGFDPVLQFLHVEDAALAIFKLLKARRTGVYNVAPDDALNLISIARTTKKTIARYSPRFAAAIAGAGHALGLRGPAGLGPMALALLKRPLFLSNRKIKRDVGYIFKYACEGAIADHMRAIAARGAA